MSLPKYAQFLTNLEDFLTRKNADDLRLSIGDSIYNNRVPTINQVIRFLTRKSASKQQRLLGKQLSAAYELLKQDIKVNRRVLRGAVRTDAFDINEFINTYKDVVILGTTSYRRTISRHLAA